MIAVFSDVHSNYAALSAVLKDIAQNNCQKIICLGDTVGYGPCPNECVDLIKKCTTVIMGNHDSAVESGGERFNARAKQAIEWTKNNLTDENRRYLSSLNTISQDGKISFVHGSPRNHISEYIFPQDIGKADKIDDIFSQIGQLCFVGHTHFPGVILDSRDFLATKDICNVYMMDNHKAIINVGSVGQPRDEDNRASYVTFDGDTVVFRRVSYNVNETVKKIYEIPELDNFLADRLLVGK